MEAAGEAVRVMTVHAAKGLEAPDRLPARHVRRAVRRARSRDRHASARATTRSSRGARARSTIRRQLTDDARRLPHRGGARAPAPALCRDDARRRTAVRVRLSGPERAEGRLLAPHDLQRARRRARTRARALERRRRGAAAADRRRCSKTKSAIDAPAIKARRPPGCSRRRAREKPPEPPISPSSALSAADQTSEAGLDHAGADPLAQNGEGMRVGSLTHTLLQYLPDVPREARRGRCAALPGGARGRSTTRRAGRRWRARARRAGRSRARGDLRPGLARGGERLRPHQRARGARSPSSGRSTGSPSATIS